MFAIPRFSYQLTPNPEVQFNQALAAHKNGDLATARRLYTVILKSQPDHLDAVHLLGVVEGALGNHEIAIQHIERAILLAPTNAACHLNLGNVYRGNGQLGMAIAEYVKAVELRSDYHMAFSNLGAVYEQLGDFEKATAAYDKALAIAPDFPEAQWNRGALALLLGDFETGWRLAESRWAVKAHQMGKTRLDGIRWTGIEPLANKTIVLTAEQGLGDTIQFSRYALLLKDRGATVVLQVPKTLMALLQTLDEDVRVVSDSEQPPLYDYYCSMGSLPLAFGTTLASIPAYKSYLAADKVHSHAWSKRLSLIKKPHIGLVWSGNPEHLNDRNRSITLETLLSALPKNCHYVCLQKEVRPEDQIILASKPELLSVGPCLGDFSDTSAVCANLDAVVSVDTSVAHLAGAMGIPTKMLIPFAPDWRWLLCRNDSPWYPSIRLYRQEAIGDWSHALGEVAADLRSLFPN